MKSVFLRTARALLIGYLVASMALTAQGGRHPQPLDIQPVPPQPPQQTALDGSVLVAEEAGKHVQMGITHPVRLGGQETFVDDPLVLNRRVVLQDDVQHRDPPNSTAFFKMTPLVALLDAVR